MRAIQVSILLAAFVLAQAGIAQAQQDTRGTDFMIQRMKERLKLSDEQAAKLKEILNGDTEERTKLDDARTAKINGILDADQKKQYEEFRTQMQRGGRNFGPGGPQGGFGGGAPRAMGTITVDDAKRDLGLTDEQVEKVRPLYDEFNAELAKRSQELQEKGFQGFNLGESMAKYQESTKALAEKVRVHLTDEQKSKLDAKMEQINGMLRFLPNLMGARSGGDRAPARPSVEDRVRTAVNALKVENADERAAISDLVAKVVKAQYDLEDFTKSAKEKLAEAARNRELSDAAVEDRIKEFQEDRRKREKEIAGLQKQLAEVVTNRQELELMAEGILK